MKNDQTIALPSTVDECHKMIMRQAEHIAWLEQRLFGSKKDRAVPYDGPTLFDDYFKQAEAERAEALDQAAAEVDAHAAKRRAEAKKPVNANRPSKYLYSGLREETTVKWPEGVDLDEYDVIGRDVTRLLHFRKAEVWVECIERPVLRRKGEKDALRASIVQAPAPAAIIGGNHVAADMLAQLVVNKFTYHIPEHRQAKMLSDLGVTLPRSTMNDWVHAVANLLYPLYEIQCEAVRAGGYLQVDEVPWKIADRPGKACRAGYAWQFRDVGRSSRGTFFYYHKGSRGGEIARSQLRGYQGIIQTDGYKVYEIFEHVPGVTSLACWAHVRRKFVDAQKSHPMAGEVVKHIATLYALEKNLRHDGATEEQIREQRQRLARPIIDGIEAWMWAALPKCTPKDPLANAISYAQSLWTRLVRYTENGLYHIDTNPVERGQRPTVLGRKNFLFSQNDRGAEDNAVFYTFLVSCDNLGVPPLEWLTRTLEKIKPDMDEEQLKALLPCNYKADAS